MLKIESTGRLALKCATVGLVLALSVRDASAGWQYTRWGMTPEQVISASRGTATWNVDEAPGPHVHQHALVVGRHAVDGMPFTLRFLFGANDRLLRCVAVRLADNSKVNQFRSALLRIYGQPNSTEKIPGMEVLTWQKEDEITFTKWPDASYVAYCSRQGRGL